MGVLFGLGGLNIVFGLLGLGNFMICMIVILVGLFFLISFFLGVMIVNCESVEDEWNNLEVLVVVEELVELLVD